MSRNPKNKRAAAVKGKARTDIITSFALSSNLNR